jgi:DNA (cytosine-5)-methyltransferase 1
MFPEVIRAIREARPRAFILENVRGLTRPSFLPYFHYLIAQLKQPRRIRKADEHWYEHHERLGRPGRSELAYDVAFRVINAADFGVPQQRHRIVIVGIRSDLGVSALIPRETHSRDQLLLDQQTGCYFEEHSLAVPASLSARQFTLGTELSRWQTTRDALRGLPDPRAEGSDSFTNHVFIDGARPYKGHTGSELDLPAKTIKAGDHGVPGGENTFQDQHGRFRYFTVREAARIQSFPDTWEFPVSRTEAMRQIGNAVPVMLAEAVANSVKTSLRLEDDRSTPPRTPQVQPARA